MSTIRLTMAQALTRYLARQMTEIDGKKVPLIAGVWAIFGHGNVAALGEALYQVRDELPTYRAHNEQAMAHAAIAFAKASFRRRDGGDEFDRAWRHQHGDSCSGRACEPPAAPSLARRRLPPIAGRTRSCSRSRISPMARLQRMTV